MAENSVSRGGSELNYIKFISFKIIGILRFMETVYCCKFVTKDVGEFKAYS